MKGKLIIVAILLLAGLLRLHNFTTWPREGATFDEYAWVWLGMNIIQKGVPISWSPHPQYKIKTHYIAPGGARFWLVQPYLEHPPLFGLVAGGYALFRGADDMFTVSLPTMRELALILGIVSTYLVFLLATSIYGNTAGLLSALFYAITPTIVIGSRILENENFFIPLFLGMLLFLKKYLDSGKRTYLIAAAMASGIAILSKIPWIAASVSAVFILLYKKKWKETILFVSIVAPIFALYFFYGMLWDTDLFFSLWRLQLTRYDMAFDSMFALFQQPYLVDRYYTDGWIYAGWIAFALLTTNLKKNYILLFGLLGYLLVYIAAIPNEPSHGWYRYPFYPFLTIALATFILDKPANYLLVPMVFLGVALSLLQHTWAQVLGFSYVVHRGIILWFSISSLSVLIGEKRAMKFAHWNTVLQVVTIILLSVSSILLYNEQ